MAKISLNLIVTLLSLIIGALRGALNLAAKIADIVDNGKQDDSYVRPVWMMNVDAGLEYVARAITCLEVASGFAVRDVKACEDE